MGRKGPQKSDRMSRKGKEGRREWAGRDSVAGVHDVQPVRPKAGEGRGHRQRLQHIQSDTQVETGAEIERGGRWVLRNPWLFLELPDEIVGYSVQFKIILVKITVHNLERLVGIEREQISWLPRVRKEKKGGRE